MKISNAQIEAVLAATKEATSESDVDTAVLRLVDHDLIQQTVENVKNMPDREDMIASLKARIEANEYNPSGEDIADAMIRRSIADRLS